MACKCMEERGKTIAAKKERGDREKYSEFTMKDNKRKGKGRERV